MRKRFAWFPRIKDSFIPHAVEFSARPITYVEIGVWAGDSASWICEHVLTHGESRGYGIDHYPPDLKHSDAEIHAIRMQARERLLPYETTGRWTWIDMPSQKALRTWQYGAIDLLYIDGSHLASDVLTDFVLAWPHLRVGSGIIFDDLHPRRKPRVPHVAEAVKAITLCFKGLIEVWPPESTSQWNCKVTHKHPSEQ